MDGLWSDVSKRRRIQDPKPINAMKHNEVGRLSLEGATRQDVQAQVLSTMAGAVRATQGAGQGVGRLGTWDVRDPEVFATWIVLGHVEPPSHLLSTKAIASCTYMWASYWVYF